MGNAQNTKDSNGGNDTSPKTVNWNLLEEPNHKGLYDNYSELIYIRNNNKEMFSDYASFSMACTTSNWNYGRTISSVVGDKELYTFINPRVTGSYTMRVSFQHPTNDYYQIMSQSYGSTPTFDAASGTVTVPANCYVVIGSKTLAGADDITIDLPDNGLKAYGTSGQIVITSAIQPVDIFTLDGKIINRVGEPTTVSVVPGLYLLRSGTQTMKVSTL